MELIFALGFSIILLIGLTFFFMSEGIPAWIQNLSGKSSTIWIFGNSFNVYNDNNNLLVKDIKSVGGSVGGILPIYKYISASKCLRVSNEFVSTYTLFVN